MLKFDPATARLLEDAYHGSDFTRRRLANLEALDPHPGERIADIGCGPGMLALELARAVGETGAVVCIDPSEDMRKLAVTRCSDRPNIEIVDGTATRLPLADAGMDKAVSVQVFEYLDNIPAALQEAKRVLRAGGRLVVGDMHWDSLVWASDDPARMTRMMKAWDGHLADRCVPERLPGLLRDAGFTVEHVRPLAILDTTLRPDGLANMLIHLIRAYALEKKLLAENEIRAWVEEQRALAAAGRFFFAITHFVVAARVP